MREGVLPENSVGVAPSQVFTSIARAWSGGEVAMEALEDPAITSRFGWTPGFAWADRFEKAIGGKIGFLEGEAFHLWHGDIRLRGYDTRYRGFEQFDFDPEMDILPSLSGAW